MAKSFVYIWTGDLKIVSMEKFLEKNPVLQRDITPAENVANILSSMPAGDVESFWQHVVRSARFSVERGETDEQMAARMHSDIMALTTAHKRDMGQ